MKGSRYPDYLLDTNQLRALLEINNANHVIAQDHYDHVPKETICIPVVTVVESFRGHVNNVKPNDPLKRTKVKYAFFLTYFRWLSNHRILEFDDACLVQYENLKKPETPVEENDKRIAAIALCRNCKIVTANRRHFVALGVPEDQIVDWMIARDFIS